MLETIREYGQECLQASADYQEIQRLHATYYLLLVEQAEGDLVGLEGSGWLKRLDREINNIRQALGWWRTCGKHERVLRTGSALKQFWLLKGYGREGYPRRPLYPSRWYLCLVEALEGAYRWVKDTELNA